VDVALKELVTDACGCGPRTCWSVTSTRSTTCRTQITAKRADQWTARRSTGGVAVQDGFPCFCVFRS
jgi:hypothetical protein